MPLSLTEYDIQQFIPVVNDFVPTSFTDYIRQAEEDYLMPELGEELYEAIIQNAGDAHPERLKNQLARAACHLAWNLYLPFQEATINNDGVTQRKSETFIAARSETIERMQASFQQIGFKELEKVLAYVEAHATDEKYAGWKKGASYALATELLIPNLSAFERHVSINTSRRLFARIIPSLRLVEMNELRPILTDAYTVTLKTLPESPARSRLLDGIVLPALAKLALADALPVIALTFGHDTVLAFDNAGANYAKGYSSSPAEQVQNVAAGLRQQGKELIAQILPFLRENKEQYPGSPQPTEAALPKFDNDKFSSVVGFF